MDAIKPFAQTTRPQTRVEWCRCSLGNLQHCLIC